MYTNPTGFLPPAGGKKGKLGVNYDPLPWTDFFDEKIMIKDVS
jgi:hypothetical protein